MKTTIRWLSVLLVLAALFLGARALPLDTGVERLKSWVDDLGVWGPVVFGALYVVGVLLFVPGLALTLAAGGVFGLLWGLVTVSLASITAAALAFLIARYLARSKIEGMARRHPKFRAVDRAIGDGGWKIVAMLRLVPLFPFSAGNYLFGLTSVRFWPYVLASWPFMLPGTLMYVYAGFLGFRGLEAASEENPTLAAWEAVLWVVGFMVLVVAIGYMTRLAKRRLIEATPLDAGTVEGDGTVQEETTRKGWAGTAVLAVVAVAMFAGSIWARQNEDRFAGLFGPPVVRSAEAYQDEEGTAHFDHGRYDALLKSFVDEEGRVDYRGLRGRKEELDAYVASLADAPFEELGRDEKLALLINAYNAFTLTLILEHYPVESIMEIPADRRWKDVRWTVAGEDCSLDQIEHQQIRPKFAEPRIHFALVCAAVGCPVLRGEAYVGKRLEEQLEDQTRYAHEHDRWFRYDAGENVVYLTKLYDWYRTDFVQEAGSVLAFAARYAKELREALDEDAEPEIRYLDYDWSLNEQEER